MCRICYFLPFIFLSYFIVGCDPNIKDNKANKTTTDSAIFNSGFTLYGSFNKDQALHYYYRDLLNQDYNVLNAITNDTTIKNNVITNVPMEIIFNEGPYTIKYIFFPGDSVRIIYKSHNHYQLSSSDTTRQNELNFQLVNDPEIDVSLSNSTERNYDFIRKDLLKQYTYWSKKIKTAQSNKHISDQFAEYYQLLLKSKLITKLLYPVYRPDKSKDLNEIDEELIKELLVFDGKYLGLTSYRYALWHYLKFQVLNTDKAITADLLATTAINNYNGEIRDFFLAQTISEQVEKGNLGSWTNEKEIYEHVETERYKKYILTELQSKSIVNGALLKMDNNETIDIKEFFKMKKDTLVFIDLWASWCMPCREEMKYYPNLIQKFSNQKIQFIFFSLDKSLSAWMDGLKDYEFMKNNNSFLVGKNFHSEFATRLNVQSIPRYVVIKNAEVLVANAARPSDKNIVAYIEDLLK